MAPLEDQLVVKVAAPGERIVPARPFMRGNRPERLLDLDDFPAASAPPAKDAGMVEFDRTDGLENGFENEAILSASSEFAERVESPPAELDGAVELDDSVEFKAEGLVLADDRAQLEIRTIAGIEHEWWSEWVGGEGKALKGVPNSAGCLEK